MENKLAVIESRYEAKIKVFQSSCVDISLAQPAAQPETDSRVDKLEGLCARLTAEIDAIVSRFEQDRLLVADLISVAEKRCSDTESRCLEEVQESSKESRLPTLLPTVPLRTPKVENMDMSSFFCKSTGHVGETPSKYLDASLPATCSTLTPQKQHQALASMSAQSAVATSQPLTISSLVSVDDVAVDVPVQRVVPVQVEVPVTVEVPVQMQSKHWSCSPTPLNTEPTIGRPS
jgi:hypothetical protein